LSDTSCVVPLAIVSTFGIIGASRNQYQSWLARAELSCQFS
jgi:hypothetical protein